jgi:hypothetical protein
MKKKQPKRRDILLSFLVACSVLLCFIYLVYTSSEHQQVFLSNSTIIQGKIADKRKYSKLISGSPVTYFYFSVKYYNKKLKNEFTKDGNVYSDIYEKYKIDDKIQILLVEDDNIIEVKNTFDRNLNPSPFAKITSNIFTIIMIILSGTLSLYMLYGWLFYEKLKKKGKL